MAEAHHIKGAMMSGLDLTLAILALLMTPGPTNSLVLLAGAERGLAGALRLVPAELAGYLLTVGPLALFGAAVMAELPMLRMVVTLAAAVWVSALAVRLWRMLPAGPGRPAVDARALFVTTALNPKALIFGLVLLPSPEGVAGNVALFAGLVGLVALFWAWLGAALGGRGQPRALFLLRRLASVVLGAMSLVLALRGVGA